MPASSAPFAPGSVSLRCYPHLDLPAPQIVDELRTQAALAVEHGFDGVMTSEHHGGFAGYLPNPLQTAGFALDAMPTRLGGAVPAPVAAAPGRARDRGDGVARGAPSRVGSGSAWPRARCRPTSRSWARRWTTSRRASRRRWSSSRRVLGGGEAGRARRRSRRSRAAATIRYRCSARPAARPRRAAPPRSAPGWCSTRSPRRLVAASSSTRTAPRAGPARACSSGGPGSANRPRS